MSRYHRVVAVLGLTALAASPAGAQLEGYMNEQQLQQRLERVAGSSDHARLEKLGESIERRAIHILTLSSGSPGAERRPALLITAGIDGRYLVGTEAAVRIGERLLDEHPTLLEHMTVYIVPRVNPDGAARNFVGPISGHAGNARDLDDDRDRRVREDSADDLNGDGVITLMRRIDPPIEDAPTHLADPDDPRLHIKPEADEGQRASFTLYPEGLDNDGDGQFNEDGFGFVDLNQNFMHMWPEHERHSGAHPLSEPEANAMAQFVLDHPNIVMALTLGEHDTLVNMPDTKNKDITGRAPKGIDAGDKALYKRVGGWFTDATGMKEATAGDARGSLHAWVYAQRGIPSFAANPWSRPEPKSEKNDEHDGVPAEQDQEPESPEPELTPSPIGDISQETLDELMAAYEEVAGQPVDQSLMAQITPQMVEQFAAQAGIEVRRVSQNQEQADGSKEASAEQQKKKKQSEEARWLAYFEEQGVDGFADWTPYNHPTLGEVEIGGFKPLARINPPASDLDDLSSKHTEFVVKLLEMRPRVKFTAPQVERIGPGLYELRVAIENHGRMPTATAFGQSSRTVRPMVLRLSVDVDQIVSGQRIERVWGLDADGGRSEHHWIFRTDDISAETIEIVDPRFGNRTIELADPERGE